MSELTRKIYFESQLTVQEQYPEHPCSSLTPSESKPSEAGAREVTVSGPTHGSPWKCHRCGTLSPAKSTACKCGVKT